VTSVSHWKQFPGLLHGFLGRAGGVSKAPFDSLNLSFRVGDDPISVGENWHLWKNSLPPTKVQIVTPKQVHGAKVLSVDPTSPKEAGEADALWTQHSGVLIGVLTADCVPVLLCEPERQICAAVHAGWRGTSKEIAIKVVQVLCSEGKAAPSSLFAALGPSISGCCYAVGTEVIDGFPIRWRRFGWSKIEGRHHLDLRALNHLQLMEAGLREEKIALVGPCTSCQVHDFFSSRRSGNPTGRQLSYIGWSTDKTITTD
jgi:YfiH family protein